MIPLVRSYWKCATPPPNLISENDFFCFQEIFLQGSPELSQTSKPQNQVCDVYNDGYNVMMIPNMRLNFKIDVEKICSYQRMMLHKHKKKIEDDVKIYGKDKV